MFDYMPENDEYVILDALRFYVENSYAKMADINVARKYIGCVSSDTWLGLTKVNPIGAVCSKTL